MSEQLSYELYKWFTTLEILPNNLRYKTNGNYELDSKSSEGLIGGYLISKLLLYLAKQLKANINQPLVSSIKQSSTPAARVYNWNILTESFTKLNVTITKETQKEITSGNFNTLIKFLLDLHKKLNTKKIEKKEETNNSQINLNKLQILQTFDQAQNFLQLAIMIISQTLNLTPKQTLSTLNDNAKYYSHMIVKGIKNNFAEIIIMLQTFISQIGKLLFLAQKNPEKNIQFFLDLVKPTLISRDLDVAKKGCELFRKLIDQSLRYNSKNLVYQILCKESVGFDFLYMGLKRHPDLILEFTSFLYPLIRQAFNDFFEIHLKRTINNQQQYLKIILRIIQGLTASPQSKGVLKQSGLLKIWLQNSETSFERKKNKQQNPINQQTKILYLQLLCNLWKSYSTEVDQQYAQELLIKGIQQLKKNTRKQIYTIKIPALLRLFDFLHYLADNKNKVASILYKKLIFLFIENHDQQEIRQLILANFRIVLQKFPTIPIEFLLDPFLKQLINSEGKTYILNVYDFQFMIELCKHPRMDASYALSYLQYLSKLYIKSFIYARLVIRVIEVLTSRFCQEETIVQFLKKNIESTLNLYGILTFNKKKMNREQAIMNKQKKSLAIELIKHYAKLEHQQLGNFIKEKVSALYLLWLQTKRHQNKGLKYLIQLYGDVEEVCLQTKVKETLKKQEDFQKYQNQNNNLSQEVINIQKPTPNSDTYRQLQYMQEKGIGYKGNKKSQRTAQNGQIEKSTQKPNPTALQQLQRIKQKMKGQASRKKQLEDLQLKKIKQKNSANSIQLFQRNLSLGYAKLTTQSDSQILFEFDTVKPKQLKLAIHFHSLEQLESIDKQSTKVILKNYSKDIKSLFLKYSLISSTQNARKQQSIPVMSFTQVVKMLNEKGLNFVNKLVVSDMISSINYNKRKERNILFGIEEPQFNQFLIKLTDYLIQNQPSSPEVPFGLRLQYLLKTLFTNQNFFENRFRIKESPNILQLRESLKNDQFAQQAVIPQGYKKVKQNQVDLIYSPNDSDWGIPQKKLIGYELTDWLINRCLGFHIISPKVQIKQRYTLIQIPKPIKPKLPKQETNPNIKSQTIDVQDQNNNEFLSPADISTPARMSEKGKKKQRMERRSQSQRAINKQRAEMPMDQEQKQKNIKREKYVQKVKQNLQKLRKEKAIKEEEDKKKELQKKQLQKKKQQERQNYLNANKQKVAQYKKKEIKQKNQKQQQEQKKKQALIQQQKKKQKQYLEKHKEDIKKRADVLSQKRKQLQNSKDKKIKQFEKLAKQATVIKQDVQNDKLKMLQIKNSLENGKLKTLTDQYSKQFTDLYQSYWNWEKKRIELNSIALIFKDFKISPELIHPKIIAQVYKNVGKGQTLDYNEFIECVAKCAYKSPKFAQQNSSQQQSIDPKNFQKMINKLRMEEDNYKQVIKAVKHHLE